MVVVFELGTVYPRVGAERHSTNELGLQGLAFRFRPQDVIGASAGLF